MKFVGVRLVTVAEVLLIGAITYLIYTLWGAGDHLKCNLAGDTPEVMRLDSARECKDNVCLDLLSEVERTQYYQCYNKSISPASANKFGPISEGICHFQDGVGRLSVGLGSFQGSGNTWLRGLLEKVTGICTGNQ